MKTTRNTVGHQVSLWIVRVIWLAAVVGGFASSAYALWATHDFQQTGTVPVDGDWNANFTAIVLTPKTPEMAALIHPGDILLAQDGLALPRRLTYSRVSIPPVMGKLGTETTITIQTPGEAPRDVHLKLDLIPNDVTRGLVKRGVPKETLDGLWLGFDFLKMAYYWLLAFFIAFRRPHDQVALITSGALMLFAARLQSAEYLRYIPAYQYPLQTLVAFTSASIYLMVQFPDGRWYPRRVTIPLFCGYVLLYVNRFTGTIDILNRYFLILDMAFIVCLVFVQFYRYRNHYNLLQKQQTRWLMAGMLVMWTLFYLANLYIMLGGIYGGLVQGFVSSLLQLVLLVVPLTITVSMLRYRLYDADYALNRSLVFSTVTLLLATFFTLIVLILRLILPDSENRTLILVIAAVCVGAVFAPVRNRLQSLIDHRFFRLRLDLHELAQRRKETQKSRDGGLFSGQTLNNTLHLDTLIGVGGMGEVYEGRIGTQRLAVKVLRPEQATAPEAVQRFEQEATLMRRISHPNIVHMIDSGVVDNTHFIVMEYVDGQPLDTYLKQKERLPLDQTRRILKDVAAGLDYLHVMGIIHRDIKPGNVILQEMRAVLTDFSIARADDRSSSITTEGLVGTLDYIAPEQITMASTIDHRADVYSLGVMAYQMLTGELPFKGGVGQLVFAHLHTPAPNVCDLRPDIPPHVGETILRAMFKDPDDRFDTAKAFMAALSPV